MTHQPVAAAQIIIAIIPIVAIVMASVLIFFYLLWRHKQIICQIQTKTYTPIQFNIKTFCLILGILLSIVGLVLSILFLHLEGVSYVLLGGLVPTGCGIGLLIYYIISYKLENRDNR